LIEGYLGSVHGKALFGAGLITAPTCSNCHGGHGILAAAHPASRTNLANVPRTCGECHAYILDTWVSDSIHGRHWQQGGNGPVCISCHKSHKIDSPRSESARLKCPEICGGCHEDRYSSYRVTFHGQATDLGFKAAANCSDCHAPHRILPAKHTGSSVHTDNLVETCGQCHDRVPSGLLSFKIHFEAEDPNQHAAIYFTGLFMSMLLIVVFGMFAVHDLLWLQRSLVGVLRGEFTKKKRMENRYLRRFSTADIGLHIAVILSFLVLAATGLMLKFHFAAWAGVSVEMLGGLSVTRMLHRLAALITLAYVLFHLFSLFKQSRVEGDYAIFWGWRSMVPRGKDWRDLIRHLRYFLYLGPRPAFDRWTYWEKFDYFAVFWGVVTIGVSGLMLWFPTVFTRMVPGWTLNAAQLVHSEEALLAVGFVLVFHFFHSHLRPESFPMDPTIFTGIIS
jgi:thiosulfate reductase cytochrome b subunit